MIQLDITENEQQQRLDRFLKKYFRNAPLSRIYKMIRKDVKVNGRRAKEDVQLQLGDVVTVFIGQEEAEELSARPAAVRAKRQFKIVYEDENILLAEKPYGLLVHGDRTEKKNTLANQVVDYLIETGAYVPRREKTFVPSPVNRLDRNTTGIVIFGKNAPALQALNRMLREKDYVEKYYLTAVRGSLKEELYLKGYLWKDESRNQAQVLLEYREGSRAIETEARPVKEGSGCTLVEVHLITGRTHQIRAHLSSVGYPVIGDEKYGNPQINRKIQTQYGLSSQFLHAYRLRFRDALPPLEYLKDREFTAPLPPLLQSVEEGLFGTQPKTERGETTGSRRKEKNTAGSRGGRPKPQRREKNAAGSHSGEKRPGGRNRNTKKRES